MRNAQTDPHRSFEMRVPRSVYDDALSPLCSAMAEEIGLPEPTMVKVGKGAQMVYEGVTADQALEVADYIGSRGSTLLGDRVQDPYDIWEKRQRNTYRAAIKAAERIRKDVTA